MLWGHQRSRLAFSRPPHCTPGRTQPHLGGGHHGDEVPGPLRPSLVPNTPRKLPRDSQATLRPSRCSNDVKQN